jgi:hypothetical protein
MVVVLEFGYGFCVSLFIKSRRHSGVQRIIHASSRGAARTSPASPLNAHKPTA